MNLADPVFLAKLAMVIFCINVAVGAVKTMLEKIAPTTETKIDDEAVGIIGYIQKFLDLITGNLPH